MIVESGTVALACLVEAAGSRVHDHPEQHVPLILWVVSRCAGAGMQDALGKMGRLTFPIAMLAYPFYLWKRSPGKEGSHYDPKCDLFTPAEEPLVSLGALTYCCMEESVNRSMWVP